MKNSKNTQLSNIFSADDKFKIELEEKAIIERFKKRRKELGLSFQDLAERTGMSKSTLQRYEAGTITRVPLSRLDILAEALQCSLFYLVTGEEEEKKNALPDDDSALNAMILERFSRLTPENRLEVLEFLERKLRGQESE